jgi:N-methylhydantoinase B
LAFVARCLVDDRVPANDGFLGRLEVAGPDGLVCTAVRPAAVVGGWEMGQRIVEVIFKALHPALPDRIPAAGKGLIVNIGFGGHNPIAGEYYCYMETIAGGNGARPGKDGPDAVQTNLHNTENAPIEEVELNYPIRITRYELIEDSAGAGEWRGGVGVRRDFQFPYADCAFTVMSDGRKFPPWGLAGGGNARPAHFILDPDGEARELPSKITIDIPQGGVVSVQTPGGGGFGDPAAREPERIRRDIRNGKLSPRQAKRLYGYGDD